MSVLGQIESVLAKILDEERCGESLRWAVEGGGKRVRPQICLLSAVAAGGRVEDAVMPACAIELLHSYTLVHDDLPAMDNDDMRRGKPSVWAKFGESNAILAGDELQALAFRVAARVPRNADRIVASLAAAAVNVVRGQVADLGEGEKGRRGEGERELRIENGELRIAGKGDTDLSTSQLSAFSPSHLLNFIFENKTAALFVAAAEMGALAAGASDAVVAALGSYARNLGFAFQYEDDLLDADDGAFSSLTILGRDEVVRRVRAHTDAAIAALAGLSGDTGPLASLASGLVSRNR